MNKKIIGIFIVMLLIVTIVIPVTGRISTYKDNFIDGYEEKLKVDNTELKWVIAGESLRCLRFYQIHIPSSYDGSEEVPLVIVFHGSTSIGSKFNPFLIPWFYKDDFLENYLKFSEKADEENFIVVYPKSLFFYSPPPFNQYLFAFGVPVYPDSWFRWRNLVDDVGFIEDLIDKLLNNYNIDSNKIYLTGLSNGADMIYSLGCLLSDKIAAISPVAGEIAKKEEYEEEYNYPPVPENPVSIIVFHGTNDSAYPWDGDEWGCGVDSSIQFWINNNNCDSVPDIYESDSGNIFRYTYSNGDAGSEVILYKIIDGSHCWPGNDYTDPNNVAPWLVDNIKEIDATDLIWEFFEVHPKQ